MAMAGRKRKLNEDELVQVWKRVRGNMKEIERFYADREGVSYKTIQRTIKRLRAEGKLTEKRNIPASEVAEVVTDFDSLPEIRSYKAYLHDPTEDRSEGYIERCLRVNKKAWQYLNKKSPSTWSSADILSFIAHERARGLDDDTLYTEIGALRSLQLHLGEEGVVPSDEAFKIQRKIKNRGLKKKPETVFSLTREEFERFVDALKSTCADEYGKKAFEALAWVKVTTGMRTGDPYYRGTGTGIMGLLMSQMREEGDKIYFDRVREKGRHGGKYWDNVLPSPTAIKKLREYLAMRNQLGIHSDFVFSKPNGEPISTELLREKFAKASELDGIKTKVTPHILRHTYLTWLVDSGVPLEEAIDLNVGWTDLQTAKDYYLTKFNRKKEVELAKLWEHEKL